MTQDKRQQGPEFDKHQDQGAKSRQGERSVADTGKQQSGQPGTQPNQRQPDQQQGGQRERTDSGSKDGGQSGQRR